MNYKGISNPKLITVFELTKEAHSSMDTEKCVSTILRRISDILDTEVGSVMLVDEKRQELFIKKASGLDSDVVKQTRVKIGESVSGWVAKEGKSLLVKDISRDSRFKKRSKSKSKKYATNSLLSVPFKVGGKVIGVINVNNKKAKLNFNDKDLALLTLVSEQTGLAIQNALIYGEAKRLAGLKLDFVSNISHELKTPLAIIRDSISLASEGIDGDVHSRENHLIEMASRNIERLDRLLDSLLDLAKFEAGRVSLERTYLDIKKLITDCVDFIKPAAEKKSIKIKINFLITYSKVWADHDKITQVINNLLSNALKFTAEGGSIDVTVKKRDKNVLISVQDSGVGIRKKDISKLFNKFERLDASAKGAKGTGLGLVICNEIVGAHNGKIWAIGKPGKGCRFNILLPKDLRERGKVD